MDSNKVLSELNNINLEGVEFIKDTFKPVSIQGVAKYPKYQDESCNGIRISVIDKEKIDPLEITISILKIIYKNHPENFSFNNNDFISQLYGSDDLKSNIVNKQPISILFNTWNEDSRQFIINRKPYLLY